MIDTDLAYQNLGKKDLEGILLLTEQSSLLVINNSELFDPRTYKTKFFEVPESKQKEFNRRLDEINDYIANKLKEQVSEFIPEDISTLTEEQQETVQQYLKEARQKEQELYKEFTTEIDSETYLKKRDPSFVETKDHYELLNLDDFAQFSPEVKNPHRHPPLLSKDIIDKCTKEITEEQAMLLAL